MLVSNWHVAMRASSHGCRSWNMVALVLSGLGTVVLVMLKLRMVLKLPFVSNANVGYPLACCAWPDGSMWNIPGAVRWCSRYQ